MIEPVNTNYDKPLIGIVVLQFNQSEETIKCLEPIKNILYSNHIIIVVDNASDTKHFKNIEYWIANSKSEKFILIDNKNNLGYGGGNNIGIKRALEMGADYVFILNNDCIVEPNILDNLLNSCVNKNADIAQACIIENNKIIKAGEINWLSPNGSHITDMESNLEFIDYPFYAIGAALFVSKNILMKNIFFDEKYFLYFEDADFSFTARSAGFKIISAMDSIVRHGGGASTNALGINKMYYTFRNMLFFNHKYAPFYVRIIIPFWIFYFKIKQRIKILFGIDSEKSQLILQAINDYGKQITGIKIQ